MNIGNRKVVWRTFTILILLQFCTALSAFVPPAKAVGTMKIVSHTGYLDSSGYYRVVGEVQNIGTQTVNYVIVNATYYNTYNILIDFRFDLTLLTTIPAGRKSPFRLALLDALESSQVTHYSLTVTYQETADVPQKLEILQTLNNTDLQGNLHIVGYFQNLGNETLTNAKVVATYYDASTNVVAAQLQSFDPEVIGDITANRTVSFDIPLDQSRAQYAQSYAVAVESNQYEMIPEYPSTIILLIPTILLFALTAEKTRRRTRMTK